MDDGLIWEKEKWFGRWCWSVSKCDFQWGFGPIVIFDDHPESANRFGLYFGPYWVGVCVYHSI